MSNELQIFIDDLANITADARKSFGGLSAEQINWKPSETAWSIGQCFDHLIRINSSYFPEMENVIRGERKQNFWESYSPLTGFFGNLMVKSLDPKAERKLKAPKTGEPAASDISPQIIEDFAAHQAELTEIIRQTEKFDTKKIILTSPFLKLITYNLFDGYRIIVTHEKRHFKQAERVMETEGFPK